VPGQTVQGAVDWISDKEVEVKSTNGQSSVGVSIAPGGIAVIQLTLK
jgi:hypothetical protein